MELNTKFEKQLKQAMQNQVKIQDETHLQRVLKNTNREFLRMQGGCRISFWEFFIRQVKYLSYSIWLVQGFALLILVGILGYSYGELSLDNGWQIAILLCGCAILIMMTSVPFVERSLRYNMNEIEAATRFSTSRLLLAKLLMIGIGDGIMIAGLLLITILYTSISIINAVLYLLIPFLLMSSVVLYLIGHVPMKRFKLLCITLGGSILYGAVVMWKTCPWIFREMFNIGWIGICVILIGICISQVRYIMLRSAVIELQIM